MSEDEKKPRKKRVPSPEAKKEQMLKSWSKVDGMPRMAELEKQAARSIKLFAKGSGMPHLLEATDPAKAQRILMGFAREESGYALAEKEGLCITTIYSLRNRHPEFRERADEFRAVQAELAEDGLLAVLSKRIDMLGKDDDALSKVGVEKLAQAAKMLNEIGNSHRGKPSQVVKVEKGVGLEEAARHLEEMRRRIQKREAIDAEEVDNEREE